MSEVTNAPLPPAKDPLTPGKRTTEFLATSAGMFLAALIALLAVFDVLSLSEEQKEAIYNFCGIALIVLPAVYTFARSHVKGKAVNNISAPDVVKMISSLREK